MASTKYSRRALFLSAAGLLTAGCAGNPILRSVKSAASRAAGLPQDVEIDRATIAKIPYATIRAKFGGGPTSLLVLNSTDGLNRDWVASDNTLLVTRTGRLVKTYGFAENLRRVAFDGPDPLATRPQSIDGTVRYGMRYDLETSALNVVDVTSRLEPVGPETITIAGLDFKTLHLREKCKVPTIRWHFENNYWVDVYDGFIWRSRQHFAKSLPALVIEVLKPAA